MNKDELRQQLRQARRDHVDALPQSMQALVFHRPPAPLLDIVPDGAAIGLYRANPHEAPAQSYAKFFQEAGHVIALPRFSSRTAAMEFAEHSDPFAESDCEVGPFGLLQPGQSATSMTPQVLFVPLVGFTVEGLRLGQGGGHYDRWLADHPGTVAIGLGWDSQLVDALPVEDHDMPMTAIVTPTRMYGPFE